jgi:2-polyprenyl-6-hydroxyphenyl methylase/3-demethylubiquinone-9 3-methyltransferase
MREKKVHNMPGRTNKGKEISSFDYEVRHKLRFEFGKNWKRFLSGLTEEKIEAAENSLCSLFRVQTLSGLRILDAGSGSGLFSLAARRLGAEVVSIDYDSESVDCTRQLKSHYQEGDESWQIFEGSVLHEPFLSGLGMFDIVYSWGVVHHTGEMFNAIENLSRSVGPRGKLSLAIYNRQMVASPYWTFVKRSYVRFALTRPFFIALHFLYPVLPSIAMRLVQKRTSQRGMSVFTDLKDWLGGYPFEVARPEEVLEFMRSQKFELRFLKTVGGRSGCNEYVFEKS